MKLDGVAPLAADPPARTPPLGEISQVQKNCRYTAMMENPAKGDWINLVKEDLDKINMSLDQEELFKTISISEFKSIVKTGIRKDALNILEEKKHAHEKVRHIAHTDLKNSTRISLKKCYR